MVLSYHWVWLVPRIFKIAGPSIHRRTYREAHCTIKGEQGCPEEAGQTACSSLVSWACFRASLESAPGWPSLIIFMTKVIEKCSHLLKCFRSFQNLGLASFSLPCFSLIQDIESNNVSVSVIKDGAKWHSETLCVVLGLPPEVGLFVSHPHWFCGAHADSTHSA